MHLMCFDIRSSRQQDDSPCPDLVSSDALMLRRGKSTLSVKTLKESGISFSDLWMRVPFTYSTLAASSSGTVNVWYLNVASLTIL